MIKRFICKILKLIPANNYIEMQNNLNNKILDLKNQIQADASLYEKDKNDLLLNIDKLNQEKEFLKSELASANSKIINLISQIDRHQKQINNLNAALQQYKNDLDIALINNSNILREKAEALANLDIKCKSIDSLMGLIDNYKSLLEQSEDLLKEKEDIIVNINARYNNTTKSLITKDKETTLENEALKLQIKNLQKLCEKYRLQIFSYSNLEAERNKLNDTLTQERHDNNKKIESLNYSIEKIKEELSEKIKIKDSIIEKQQSTIEATIKTNNELEFDNLQIIRELDEIKSQNYTPKATKTEKKTQARTIRAPKNLKLTESVDIKAVAQKAGAYREVLRSSSEIEHVSPEIQHIISKLAKIKLEVSYKNGIFYYNSKKRGVEKLFIQHFEEYNEQILLLYDGRHYCGYDMGTGKKASEVHKKRIYALAELDTYYEENYCK